MKNTKKIADNLLLTKIKAGAFIISEVKPEEDAGLAFIGYLKKEGSRPNRPKRYRQWWFNGYIAAGPSVLIQDAIK